MKKLMIVLPVVAALAACSPQHTANAEASSAQSHAAMAAAAPAVWKSSQSKVSFLIGKVNKQLNSITEPAYFAESSAQLDKDGQFEMTVDLQSVHTNIDIRDQRIKDWVFETAQFPMATIKGKLDATAINNMKVGDVLLVDQPLSLNFHGKDIDINAPLLITRTAEDKITVNTRDAVVLDMRNADILKGVEKLVEVMGLSSIWEQTPVFFYGEFVRQP